MIATGPVIAVWSLPMLPMPDARDSALPHSIRSAFSVMTLHRLWNLVKKSCEVLGPLYEDRDVGYTRVLKAVFRYGDAAPVAYGYRAHGLVRPIGDHK